MVEPGWGVWAQRGSPLPPSGCGSRIAPWLPRGEGHVIAASCDTGSRPLLEALGASVVNIQGRGVEGWLVGELFF